MSTEWFFKCPDKLCKEYPPPIAGMFDMLKEKAENSDFPKCNCSRLYDIFINFEFGLYGKLLHCFYPSTIPNWRGRYNQKWEYYPFLVIVDPDDKELWSKNYYLWFPYWHVVGTKKLKKYGQWAQCLDTDVFVDLLRQAREKGYKL